MVGYYDLRRIPPHTEPLTTPRTSTSNLHQPSTIITMNDSDMVMNLENTGQKLRGSPFSSLPSSDGFCSPIPDLISISEEEILANSNRDNDDDGEVPDSPPHKHTKGCLSSIAVPASVQSSIAKASRGNAACAICTPRRSSPSPTTSLPVAPLALASPTVTPPSSVRGIPPQRPATPRQPAQHAEPHAPLRRVRQLVRRVGPVRAFILTNLCAREIAFQRARAPAHVMSG